MKKILLFTALTFAVAASTSIGNSAKADICVPADPDFDSADCLAAGGTIGTPIGIGAGPGGPGGAGQVPIDGGLTALLAMGGIAGARRFMAKRKLVQA